ncbi:non-homologous end-joining DNA ligase [Cellulomonas composti]|nr:non-homologous end-joining DNA ligase [Cellulomonas composti]
MLATPAASGVPPRGSGWAFEVKWDGVRALADTTDGRLRLWSRNGRDVAAGYPELAPLADLADTILDGEIVALADGVPSFAAIAERMHVRDRQRVAALVRRVPVTYLVFDVLRSEGVDRTADTYDERRGVLAALDLPPSVQLSPVYDDGAELWAVTLEHGLEGVVAKRRASAYRSGRRDDWVKAAHRRTRAALVGGWRSESTGSGRLGALLLGAPDESGALRYLGRAGSGLTTAAAKAIRAELDSDARATSPFDEPVPAADAAGARWCEPRLVVDVRYLTRSPAGRLRQPVVRGARLDVDPDDWETP